MRKIEGDGYSLYIEEIAAGDRQTRGVRENTAVNALVCAVFGAGARKVNDALGAPHIECAGHSLPVRVSVSHSLHFALLAVGNTELPIGADIEEWRDQLRRVVPRILTESELSALDESHSGLLAAWTGKEAIYKAVREISGHEIDYGSELLLPTVENKSACAHFRDGRRLELRLDYHTVGDDVMIAVAICRDDALRSR